MMQTSLERIAYKAQKDKGYRFQNLYGMLNAELFSFAWNKLNKNAATGVDGIDYREYGANFTENIAKLEKSLKEKKYRAKLIRRHIIPKENGKTRSLGIPSTEDKILQYSAMLIIQSIFEQDFLKCSYGYRPNKGAQQAVKDLRRTLKEENYSFIVDADVKGFFDNIDHEWIIKMLEQRIDDKAFIALIRKWLKAGILNTDGKVIHPLTGTPQGGVVSPVLANIYMHYSLCLWFEKVVKKHCNGKAHLCVYADDFVCAFEFLNDAKRFYQVIGKRLKKFMLELSPEKTRMLYFTRWSKERFDFLGFEFRVARTQGRHICLRTSRKKLQNSLNEMRKWCRENRHTRMSVLFRELNVKLQGYYNYYALKGNFKSICLFYRCLVKTLFKWLNRRGQRRSFRWEAFNKILKHYNLLRPGIYEV